MNSAANLDEIKFFAGDILRAWRTMYPMTLSQVGAHIEAQLDGTQPADLIPQAIALATSWQQRTGAC